MGRPAGARAAEKARKELAEWLRSLRQPGFTYSRMAQMSKEMGHPVSVSALWRAEQGHALPSWETAKAYTRCCGGSVSETKRLWQRAARAALAARTVKVALPRTAPALPFVTKPAELLMAMRELHLAAGHPTLRELERRAAIPGGGGSYLPRTTIGGVLNGTRACNDEVLKHFIKACGITREAEIRRWTEAWGRAYEQEGRASTYATVS